ncbi:hypothetical protein BGP_3599 [Beggiatoa sp. PS]|nr:hypothetical protein BGP_3599 [Beggiatoa sp. PS]
MPWNTQTKIWLETRGQYTIKLTLTEFAEEKGKPKVVNGQTIVEYFEVTKTDCATKMVIVYPQGSPSTPTPVDKGCQATEDRKKVGQEVVDSGDTVDTVDTGDDPIGDLIGGEGR